VGNWTAVTKRILQKWHGAGNDFLIDVIGAHAASPWGSTSAQAVCDRVTGIGADGLLVAIDSGTLVEMTLFNADGSIAEMSGNGIRCLAAAVLRVRDREQASLEVMTGAGNRVVEISLQGDAGYGTVGMGEVIACNNDLEGILAMVNVGNPHVVVRDDSSWTDEVREVLAARWAEQAGGANVEFLSGGASDISIRVIERGVGWTLACGTGSVAAAFVSRSLGESTNDVIVHNPGGDLRVSFTADFATLGGPVAFVSNYEWSIA
jgi:diaminopimelate epimerase